jgi:signal transduction histidine kinase
VNTTALNKLIEDFSQLPMDDKEYAVDVIKKQLTEAKRDAIAKRAKEAVANFKRGAIRKGTARDLYKDLEID